MSHRLHALALSQGTGSERSDGSPHRQTNRRLFHLNLKDRLTAGITNEKDPANWRGLFVVTTIHTLLNFGSPSHRPAERQVQKQVALCSISAMESASPQNS